MVEEQIKKLIEVVENGLREFASAADLVVTILDTSDYTIKELSEETKINKTVLQELERIGREQQVPELFILTYPAVRAIKRLTYDKQEMVLKKGVKVIQSDGKYVLKKAEDLTHKETRIIFNKENIRNKKEQIARMKEINEVEVIPQKPKEEYHITKDKKIRFNHDDVEYTIKDLLSIIVKLT